ncbi:DMT family transporter [Microbacterium paludicola]|uniref:DMT family transporter n=1 Tax=Microbacterium paludicola TaxID=300019 RepID=UPI001F3A5AEC|nr:DMT family transporter [Microbacterium paludicola]
MPSSRFTTRGWVLFAIMAILWGVPYLFIREAVESFSPAAVVAVRTGGAALLLLPFALRQGALKPALRKWPWVLAFAAIEMAGPFVLLAHAEQTIPSGLTGLLVATVPLFATVIAVIRGDRGALRPLRTIGLVLGFAGVAIVGLGSSGGAGADLLAMGEVLLVAVLYAIAPFIVASKLNEVPSLGTITLALGAVGLGYAPIALLTSPQPPAANSVISLALLTVLCTAVAFIVFFALIGEVGPVRAPMFTYMNPVVAVALGALILSEPLTPALLLGFPVVIVGCLLAAGGLPIGDRKRADVPILSEPDPATPRNGR